MFSAWGSACPRGHSRGDRMHASYCAIITDPREGGLLWQCWEAKPTPPGLKPGQHPPFRTFLCRHQLRPMIQRRHSAQPEDPSATWPLAAACKSQGPRHSVRHHFSVLEAAQTADIEMWVVIRGGSSGSDETLHFRRPKLFEPPEIEVSVFSLTSFLRRSLASFWTLSRSALCLE